jgi:hypothetical protein
MSDFDRRSATERAFAEKQGWKVAHRHASLRAISAGTRALKREEYANDQLGDMYDHATFYDYKESRRPAAIIVHPYRHFSQAEIYAVARRYGLTAEILEPTIYPHPDAQTIVFYRRANPLDTIQSSRPSTRTKCVGTANGGWRIHQ